MQGNELGEAWEDLQAACEGVSEAYSGFGTQLMWAGVLGLALGLVVVIIKYVIDHKIDHV